MAKQTKCKCGRNFRHHVEITYGKCFDCAAKSWQAKRNKAEQARKKPGS